MLPRHFPPSLRLHDAIPLAMVLLLPAPMHAARTVAPEAAEAETPEILARRTTGEIVLDGKLDEDAWAAAVPVTAFTQTNPMEGAPVSERTEVRILYDDEALYIGARLADDARVSTRLGRRDASMSDSDQFSVALDSYHGHVTAFVFGVNPSGVRFDEVTSSGHGGDDTWNPVWEAATAITADGWVAEMRIPFSQLRFSGAPMQTWGIQLTREIASNRETAVFAFTPKDERSGVARYGHLVGLERLVPGAKLEVVPYVVGRAEYLDVDAGNPFKDGSDHFAAAGLDVKYRLTSNLTLDATFNPDFGQVEVDPAVINLSAFETRFDEKRPFFVEGADIFDSGGSNLFYSRRIGRRPQLELPEAAAYGDVPDAATILGAVKLTGRTAGGWSVGVLEAVTSREEASYVDSAGVAGTTIVEPLSNYLVGRLRRDFRDGQTVAGIIATATHRALENDPLAAQLRSSAYTGGLDFRHEFADRAWSLSGEARYSTIAGRPEVMLDAQHSSARYYQRPDAGHLALDSTATSLAGYAARLELAKRAGLHWRGEVRASATSPGYETNDLGFQSSADRLGAGGNVAYVENRPGTVLRDWRITLSGNAEWNHGRDFLGGSLRLQARGELLSYWDGNLSYRREFAGLDDRLTRGGPLALEPAGNNLFLELSSDSRKLVTLRLSGEYAWSDAGSWHHGASVRLGLKPADNWSISLGPKLDRRRTAAHYITTIEDETATAIYNHRYIFAELARTSLSVQTRVNVTFTPELTLELYAQPLLSSGDYGAPMALRAPRTFEFVPYEDAGEEVGEEDFNTRSLRGNAVLRWEWRPGSTLFLVWQQRRSASDEIGDFDLGRDTEALAGIPPENVFQVKVSYWLAS